MPIDVVATDDAGLALDRASAFLGSDPVGHQLVRSLLARATAPQPARCWLAADGPGIVGVGIQSPPLDVPLVLTPMPADALDALVTQIAAVGVELPGVIAEAGTAARFAGAWTERRGGAATPVEGQRVYEATTVAPPTRVPGSARRAAPAEHDLLVAWLTAFRDETGAPGSEPAAVVERRLPAGELRVWDVGTPVCGAGVGPAAGGVARIGPVYTSPEHRGCGYAAALTAALTTEVLRRGERCVLHTDLGNAGSNRLYRRIGYRAVAEVLRYELG